jgi:type IV pilus assembly protein PilN
MRITLNLATRPYADLGPALRRLRIAISALVVLCLLLLLALHFVHQDAEQARARAHSVDGRLAALTQERQSYLATMQQPENAELLKQAAALNQLFDDKSFSWTLAMANLETVLPAGVQVTTIEPVREKDGHISLRLRVVGPQDRSVELVRNLEHSKRFLLPRIVGENAEESTSSNNQRLEPVSASNRFNFDIVADYNPPTLEERKAAKKTPEKSKDESPGKKAPPAAPAAKPRAAGGAR